MLRRRIVWALVAGVLAFARLASAQHIATTEPLTADEEQKRFHLPPGFEIRLVACEPAIHKPVNFSFDSRGRLWVSETVEYPFPAKMPARPRDAVKVLEDADGDGRAERVTTFVDGLNIPLGVLPIGDGAAGNGVIVFSIPSIVRHFDRDGDGHSDERRELYSTFGHRDTHGMVNSFTRGLDGWIYACHGFANESAAKGTDGRGIQLQSGNTLRFRPDGSHIEYFTHGQVNPFGLTFDPLGNLYSADCHTLPIYELLRGAYYPSFGKAHDGLGFGPTMLSHNHGSSGIGGIAYYDVGDSLPAAFPPVYRDTIFVGNPVTGRVNHDRLERHGATPRAIELPDFLTCDDPWFRPVYLQIGPDGALYIADFYNRIIGHYEVPLDHPGRDRERGRIWRVAYTGNGKSRAAKPPQISSQSLPGLLELLGSQNPLLRSQATHELVERFGKQAQQPLAALLAKPEGPSTWQKAHALWALERAGGLDDRLIERLAQDKAAAVRVNLLRALGEREGWSEQVARAVQTMLGDADAQVRSAAADALGRHPHPGNVRPLLALVASTAADDTHLLHTARMALRDQLAATADWTAQSYTPDDLTRLADACLGVPGQRAAGFLLLQLEAGAKLLPRDAFLHHIARYADPARLEPLGEMALSGSKSAQDKAAALGAVGRAYQERGIPLPIAFEKKTAAWVKELLGSSDEKLVGLGARLAVDLRPAVFDELAAAAAPSARFSGVRRAAIEACVAVDPVRAAPLLSSLLENPAEGFELRALAATQIAQANSDLARAELAKVLATAPHPLSVTIAIGLAETDAGAELLLTSIENGKASRRLLQEMGLHLRLDARSVRDRERRIAELLAGLPPESERLRHLVAERRTLVLAYPGDAARGGAVFEKHCGICHRVAGRGAKIGPNLDGIGTRGLDRLIEDVIDPNRNVDQAFRVTQLATADGRIVSGLVLREEGKVTVLADAEGKEVRVESDNIEERHTAALSPMPGNIADQITGSDLPHLMTYLLSLRETGAKPSP